MAYISYQGSTGFAPEQMFPWKGQGPQNVTLQVLVKAKRTWLLLTGQQGDFPKSPYSKMCQETLASVSFGKMPLCIQNKSVVKFYNRNMNHFVVSDLDLFLQITSKKKNNNRTLLYFSQTQMWCSGVGVCKKAAKGSAEIFRE